MKKVLALLLLINLYFSLPCFAITNKIQTNRVVVTFSPFVVNNINSTSKLFDIFSKTVKKHPTLSKKLEASGALWSVSQNLCGVQISISSSSNIEDLFQIIDLFLTESSKNVENLLKEANTNIKPVDRLYQFFIDYNASAFDSNPVSIIFFDSEGNEIKDYYNNYLREKDSNLISNNLINNDNEIASFSPLLTTNKNDVIEKYCNIYKNAYKTNQKTPIVQTVSKPILASFIGWNQLTPETFISASLIKNKFLTEDINTNNFSIELLNTGKGLVLAVYSEIEANDKIYNQYQNMCKKIDSAISDINSKEWAMWASKLLDVLKNDKRDYNKKAMFEAWYKHWAGLGFDNIPTKLDLKKPDYTKEIEIFNSLSEHNFNLSSDVYPAIYACNDKNFTDGANVSVCLNGHEKILNSIEDHISKTLQINIPITINQKHPDNIVVSFYCPEDKIPAYLSRIKASIANHLYSKFNITDLKKSVRIGIAGISSIPAYRLNGLLSLGWPTKTARYESKTANNSDLYKFVNNANNYDEKNFKLRWENITSSPQDKANILSMLACYNLIIDSWER